MQVYTICLNTRTKEETELIFKLQGSKGTIKSTYALKDIADIWTALFIHTYLYCIP